MNSHTKRNMSIYSANLYSSKQTMQILSEDYIGKYEKGNLSYVHFCFPTPSTDQISQNRELVSLTFRLYWLVLWRSLGKSIPWCGTSSGSGGKVIKLWATASDGQKSMTAENNCYGSSWRSNLTPTMLEICPAHIHNKNQ